jgi:hypothetical protein
MTTVQATLKFIFDSENIRSKEDLDNWCGVTGRQKLYNYLAWKSPEWYRGTRTPNETIRATYQVMLTGYKRSPLVARRN